MLLALIFIIFFHGLPNNEISYVLSFFKKNEYESLASKKIELQKKDWRKRTNYLLFRGWIEEKKGVLLNDGGFYQMDIHNIPWPLWETGS